MGSASNFLKNFVKGEGANVGKSIMQTIVGLDPTTASQAQLDSWVDDLDHATTEAGKAKNDFQNDKKLADAAQANYDRQVKAADILSNQLEGAKAGGDTAKAESLEKSLAKQISDLEKLKPEVDHAVQNAKDSEDYFNQLYQFAQVLGEKVKHGRETLANAQRNMQSAKIEEQRAAERAAQAEKLQGLKSSASDDIGGYATAAMDKTAADSRAKAEANKMKADILSKDGADQDDNIAAALKEASGGAPTSSSLADRLAALKNK